ncbi:MAG: glutathione S-transferase family protein [Pseudomonadales bacterium]|nr:glutathione S-transferase family protein [Pseudomonadales bacterium]
MKLYGSVASPYVARVLLVAKAKGLDLPLAETPGGGIKSAEYLAINPLGKMPAFTDDQGRHLPESVVICEYLDETAQGPSLMPTDPYDRARVRLLCRLVELYTMKELGPFFRNRDPAKRNQAEVATAREAYLSSLKNIEHYLGGGSYACGDSLTLADCVMYPSFLTSGAVLAAFGMTTQFDGLPKLTRWWQAMSTHAVAGPLGKQHLDGFMAFMNAPRA